MITVALSVDYDSGAVGGFRIFPSIIGPVFPVDISTANEIIDGVGIAEDIDGNALYRHYCKMESIRIHTYIHTYIHTPICCSRIIFT